MAALIALIVAHSTVVVSVTGYVFAQLGNTIPDLGTADFMKVWSHDFFKAITASNKKK